MYLCWVLCYAKYYNIIFYWITDKVIAAKLFDVIIQLQTNDRLLKDFGELVPVQKSAKTKEKKTVSQFITSTGVRVKASSINISPRWDNYIDKNWISHRPDLILGDDLDTVDSTKNPDIINDNYFFLKNEIFWSLSSDVKIIILGNVIREDWIIPKLRKDFKKSKKWAITWLPVEVNKKLVWNRIVRKDSDVTIKWQISLESKLEEQWPDAFNANMYLKPYASLMMNVFNLDNVEKLVPKMVIRSDIIKIAVDWHEINIWIDIFDDFKWWVVATVDVWAGKGKDYTVLNIRKKNWVLVAQMSSNRLEEYVWAHILNAVYKRGYRFYRNWLGIENNKWAWLITECRHLHWFEDCIFNMPNQMNIFEKVSATQAWWNTNWVSKDIMISHMQKLINKGYWEFSDETISEMKTYIIGTSSSRSKSLWYNAKQGCHDDHIIADAISFQVAKYCYDY